MQLRRLCLILPADEAGGGPSPPRAPPPSQPPSASRDGTETGARHLLRRSFRLFRKQVTGWVGSGCCLARCRDRDRKEEPEFQDIPGVVDGVRRPEDTAPYPNPRIFSYAELYIAASGFSKEELLGSGGYGRVYRAVLPSDGTVVAVKCVAADRPEDDRFEKTFVAELVAVAQLRHRNLVRLRGWCVHERRLLLVYDYMPNGSLDRLLFSPAAGRALCWRRRKRIVTGLAAALLYLHEQLDTQIIHRDVKSSNVMLDSGYGARLGDFGLARWTEHGGASMRSTSSSSSSAGGPNYAAFRLTDTSKIGGTIGYLPPESFQSRRGAAVTAKSDVFSFGVVVLELVAGRRAVDLSCPEEEIILLDWMRRLFDEGSCLRAGDGRLPEGSYSAAELVRLVHLGLLCTLHDPNRRPTMNWVMEALSSGADGRLPALPSFRSLPQYISLSSSSATSGTFSGSSFSRYFSATVSTVFLTAGGGSDESRTIATPTKKNNGIGRRDQDLLPAAADAAAFPIVDMPREIPLKEIVAATNNFSAAQMAAEMDFGTAYRGYLENRFPVLVKRLGMKTCPALRLRFADELRNLGQLRHRHLVQLRGWCTEQGEMLVVYDYSSAGLLSHHLFHRRYPVLPWSHRYAVVRSLASAVLYLHEEWDEQVIHRNITSSAVFLDADKNPRLGSFALAEFLTRNSHGHHRATPAASVRGIFGYLAPEYVESGEATTAADVYSFGVVVLEVVSGRRAVDFRLPEALLASRARRFGPTGQPPEELVDPRLGEGYDLRQAARLVRLGFLCTQSAPETRPSARQVASILDGNDGLLDVLCGKEGEAAEDWRRRSAAALSLVRRIQALGIY